MAHNRIVDNMRRKRIAGEVHEAIASDPVGASETSNQDSSAIAEQNQQGQQVRRALESLPNDQRDVINLSYYEGNSQAEISQRLQIPLGTLKSRMRLAMTKSRSELRSGGGN